MRKIRKRSTSYRCKVCKTDHARKKDAAACEAGDVEAKAFRVGDMVRAVDRRRCAIGHRYVCEGKVVRVTGPVPYSAEEHGKGFGLWKAAGHIYLYEVATACTKCKSKTRAMYPAACLRPIAPSVHASR